MGDEINKTKPHKTMKPEEKIEQLKREFIDKIDSLKEEIEALKNEKPKFEVGKWYKSTDCKALYFAKKVTDLKIENFGFNYKGEWMELKERTLDDDSYKIRLATPQEVEQHLIEEAKKRGLVSGVNCGWIDDCGFKNEKPNGDYFYNQPFDGLKLGYHYIYHAGKWATILEFKDQPILIGGYEVEIKKGGGCKIGCKHFTYYFLNALAAQMREGGFKEVSFDGTPATLDQINQILERLK